MAIQRIKAALVSSVILLATMISTSVVFAEGKVFWWKGSDWGRFDDPANWDVGRQGAGNDDNLIPGAEDAFAHSADAKIDLCNSTFKVLRRATDFTSGETIDNSTTVSALHLTNGTLVVTGHHSARLNIDVWNGATYRFEGSMYLDAHNLHSRAVQNIHNGGRIEIVGEMLRLFGMTMTIDEGGVLYLDPKNLACWPNISKDVPIYNNGTIEAPDGLLMASLGWIGTQPVTKGIPCIYQNGVLKLGGDFGRKTEYAGIKYLGMEITGGTVEVENSVSIINMPDRSPVIADNAEVVFEVKAGGVFDISGLAIGTGVSVTKTGAGDLKMADAVPASLAVEAGRVIFSKAAAVAQISFKSDTFVHVDAELVRIDECESFENTAFSVGESLLQIGTTILLSDDDSILAHAKVGLDAQLKSAGVQAEGRIENGALVVRSAYPYTFDAAISSDMTNPQAWLCGSVPDAEKAVRIRGAGVVDYNSQSTKFSSITVEEGATLRVSGGSDEQPVDMPQMELCYDARLLLDEGSFVQITNNFTCTCNAEVLPVFEIATNATAIVQTPGAPETRSPFSKYDAIGPDYGFRLKNVSLKWYGNIQTYHGDTATRVEYSRLLIGWAEDGETSYIAIDCRGGKYIAAGEANATTRCRTPLAIVAPLPGGTVIPIGTLYFRDYACVQRQSVAEFYDYYTPGLCIGRWNEYVSNTLVSGNPASVKFNVLFEGTVDVNINGICRIGGGAQVVLRGSGVKWRYTRKAWNDDSLLRSLIISDSGSIKLEEGATLGICSNDLAKENAYPDRTGLIAKGTENNHEALTINDSTMSALNWYGAGKCIARVKDSVLQIGYLRSANTLSNITGAFDGFKSIAIENNFTIAAADVDRGNPSKSGVIAVENWDRRVFVAPPLTGTGSLVVSNMLAGAHNVYSMTVTVTNGANTATGRAFVAETATGAPAALVFANGANWVGEVVSDGKVSLTNLVDASSAANVSFGALRLDRDFPIRVWKTGGVIAANDKVNLASVPAGEHSFSVVAMDEPLAIGDKIEIGLYPADAELPQDTRRLCYSAEPSENEDRVRLMATLSGRGMTIKIR